MRLLLIAMLACPLACAPSPTSTSAVETPPAARWERVSRKLVVLLLPEGNIQFGERALVPPGAYPIEVMQVMLREPMTTAQLADNLARHGWRFGTPRELGFYANRDNRPYPILALGADIPIPSVLGPMPVVRLGAGPFGLVGLVNHEPLWPTGTVVLVVREPFA